MLQSARHALPAVGRRSCQWRRTWRRCYSAAEAERRHDPLRILYCGADDFSIYSLRALNALQQRKPSKIASIDVLCKTDKPVDRGLKRSQAVPIKPVATELGLRCHQINTFTGWTPPTACDLVVAVSFGLLVPARILNGSKYGGLNVHPSLLPDLRGSAPIIHTLLKRRRTTGVSLQTMHPTKFDHGTILAQTEKVCVSDGTTPDELLHRLGPMGADLLCRGIDEGIFIPPLQDLRRGSSDPPHIDLAPKIATQDRRILWESWTADELMLRDRVLGDLWDAETFYRSTAGQTSFPKRVTFHGPWTKVPGGEHEPRAAGEPALAMNPSGKGMTLGIRTADGFVVIPSSATIEGKRKGKGLQALSAQLRQVLKRHVAEQKDEAHGPSDV